MSDLYFGSDLFSEFERSQRRIDELFGCFPPSTRSVRCGGSRPAWSRNSAEARRVTAGKIQ
jgi:hypothetical protein